MRKDSVAIGKVLFYYVKRLTALYRHEFTINQLILIT